MLWQKEKPSCSPVALEVGGSSELGTASVAVQPSELLVAPELFVCNPGPTHGKVACMSLHSVLVPIPDQLCLK